MPVFPLVTPVRVLNPVLLDDKEGPYIHATEAGAIALANAGVPIGIRCQGQTAVLIIAGVSKKYQWQNGTADTDLIPMTTPLPQGLSPADSPTFTSLNINGGGININDNDITARDINSTRKGLFNLLEAFQSTISTMIATVAIKFKSGAYYGSVAWAALTANRTYTFPDKNITVAGLDDVSAHSNSTSNPHNTTLEQARTAGNTFAGDVNMATHRLLNIPDALGPNEPISKQQFDSYNNSVGGNRSGIDCSANPNYPAAVKGDRFEVLQPGKIGGASGKTVDLWDEIVCAVTNAGGDQATVGANFYIVQGNMDRATQSTSGFVQLATLAEATAATDANKPLTPLTGAALIQDQRKNYTKSLTLSRGTPYLNEALIYFPNAGVISSIVGSQVTNILVKTSLGGTYAAAVFPLAVASASTLFIQFDFLSANYLNGNITVTGKDN